MWCREGLTTSWPPSSSKTVGENARRHHLIEISCRRPRRHPLLVAAGSGGHFLRLCGSFFWCHFLWIGPRVGGECSRLVRNVKHRDCEGRKQGGLTEVGGDVCGGAVIKHFPHSPLTLRVFGKPFPRSALLQLLQGGLMGRNLGYRVTVAHTPHLSPPLILRILCILMRLSN